MKNKLRLVEIIKNYVGAPYRLGGSSYSEGYDCFRLALSFGEENFGVKVPKSYKGQTLESYPELWNSDPERAKKLMFGLFSELGEKIAPNKAFVGDVLILKEGERDNVGIHAGNGLLLTVFTNLGVCLSDMRNFEIKEAYRWVVQDIDT